MRNHRLYPVVALLVVATLLLAQSPNPTLAQYLTALAAELVTIQNSIANKAQPRIRTGGQMTPMNVSFVNLGRPCDPRNGTCPFNYLPTFKSYADMLMVGAGVTDIDINMPLQMFEAAAEYAPGGGDITLASDCGGGAHIALNAAAPAGSGYFCLSLVAVDAVLLYIHTTYPNARINFRPSPSLTLLAAGGLSTTGGNTEGQLEGLNRPLIVAGAQRYAAYFYNTDIIHEPTAIFAAQVNQVFSVANIRLYIVNIGNAIVAVVPSASLSATIAGASFPTISDAAYWTDWTTNSSVINVLTNYGQDIYAGECSFGSGYYSTELAGFATQFAGAPHPVRINESGKPNWCPAGQVASESISYLGCGNSTWDSTDADRMWLTTFLHWASSVGYYGASVFPTPPWVTYVSTTTDNCSSQAYPQYVMGFLNKVSTAGANMKLTSQWFRTSAQGNSHTSGKVQF